MGSDRELIELAAKAAKLKIEWEEEHGCFWVGLGQGLACKPWEPLTDDGDALRLFCALSWMVIETSDVGVTVRERGESAGRVYFICTEWLDNHAGDVSAATRRAIVRAAAEIGKTLG